MQRINYILFRIWVALISLIPFPILYFLSDVLAWLMHHIFRYRRNVIDKNLDIAFPQSNASQKASIRMENYRNLCDIILESFKGFSMSPEAIKQRYVIDKPPFIDKLHDDGKNIVLLASHMANWEWATYTFPLYYPYLIIGMVKPVKNKYINAYTNSKRCSTGTKVLDIYKRDRKILNTANQPFILVYIADQNPSDDFNSLKVNFFGEETYCLHGAEKMARKNNWPVVHLRTKRISRGHYQLTPELISDNPNATDLTQITQGYFQQLESYISEDPGHWLWTHKRWKRNIRY